MQSRATSKTSLCHGTDWINLSITANPIPSSLSRLPTIAGNKAEP